MTTGQLAVTAVVLLCALVIAIGLVLDQIDGAIDDDFDDFAF